MKYFFLSFFFIQSTFALLPPLWQSRDEIIAILNDPGFGTHFQSGELIEHIKRTNEGWVIVTNHQRVKVKVIPKPQKMPGPAQFTIEFGG